MNIFKKFTLPKFIICLLVIYFVLQNFSSNTANFWLAVILVCTIPFLIIKSLMIDKIYQNSISIVNKKFVLNHNALNNDYCTVIYTPSEKIVVMDNITDKTHVKRMFTLTKRQVKINKAWNRLCRIFDGFTNVDSLEAFFNYDTKVDVIKIDLTEKRHDHQEVTIEKSKNSPQVVEFGTIHADPFGTEGAKTNNKNSNFINVNDLKVIKEKKRPQNNTEESFVNIGEIKKQNEKFETQSFQEEVVDIRNLDKQEQYKGKEYIKDEGVGLSDLAENRSAKININGAEASEISLLPGINIVMAKKIIEYRNLNGNFKTIEEFLAVANVKEHFISKIKEMIEFGHGQEYDPLAEDYEKGRIVDL